MIGRRSFSATGRLSANIWVHMRFFLQGKSYGRWGLIVNIDISRSAGIHGLGSRAWRIEGGVNIPPAALLTACMLALQAPPTGPIKLMHTNRLIHEKSPYLLQHAHNPVDWYAWGPEAFDAARKENKPIFLSIGYSTCHWCHVMERESFENEQIAAILNKYFIAIKVDREERPDVDRIYMAYVQATTGGGGWPMSVWLTPELKPFLGGTYFPQ